MYIQLPQPFPIRGVLQSLNHLSCFPLYPLQKPHVSLVLRSPELDPALQMHLTRAEWRGRITPPDLLAVLCLRHLRIPLAFSATRAHTESRRVTDWMDAFSSGKYAREQEQAAPLCPVPVNTFQNAGGEHPSDQRTYSQEAGEGGLPVKMGTGF